MPELMTATIIREYGRDPFLILISCLLSLRTKDAISLQASRRLFAVARTPREIEQFSMQDIAQLIYPVGFWRTKARTLQTVSAGLLSHFSGIVPANEQGLLRLKGVGRKTANLVLSEAFGLPALVVDTHVHRVANRLGIVCTSSPAETEKKLQTILPVELWNQTHRLLVTWGQNVCLPTSPWCSRCPIVNLCERRNVRRSR